MIKERSLFGHESILSWNGGRGLNSWQLSCIGAALSKEYTPTEFGTRLGLFETKDCRPSLKRRSGSALYNRVSPEGCLDVLEKYYVGNELEVSFRAVGKAGITPTQYAIILLRFSGMTDRDTGKFLKVSQQTVKNQLFDVRDVRLEGKAEVHYSPVLLLRHVLYSGIVPKGLALRLFPFSDRIKRLSALTPRRRESVAALASSDSLKAAARTMTVEYTTFKNHLHFVSRILVLPRSTHWSMMALMDLLEKPERGY